MTDSSSPRFDFKKWFSARGLFSAGLFSLVLAMYFGGKFIAAGQIFILLSLVLAFREKGVRALAWNELSPSAWWLAAFVLASIGSIVFNLELIADPVDHLGKLRFFVMVLVVLAMPWLVLGNLAVKWRRDALILAWFIPLVLAVIVGVISVWRGSHLFLGDDVANFKRVSGFYGQVMTFANSLQFSVVAMGAFLMMPSLWRKMTRIPWWVMLVVLALSGLALYLTYTRGAMLGVVTGATIYAMMRSIKLFLVLLGVGVIFGTVAYFDHSRYFDTKVPVRSNMWRAAALSFVERPVFGWGFRNFEQHSAANKERYGFEKDIVERMRKKPEVTYFKGHAHNNFLEAFASIGIFGGITFLGFLYTWLREAMRSRYALIFVPLIWAFLVSGLFENTFFDSEVLNCVLLIYLFSQWSLSLEKDAGDATPPPSRV